MAITQNTYTGDGTTVLFTISFPYLEQDNVKATLNGTPTTAFTFANSNTIQFNVAPANGVTILLFRETDSAALQNQFFPNSSIPSSSLNNNFTQGLYVAQETENTSNQAFADAATAVTTANAAVVTANAADAKSDQAILDSAAAVVTANIAESNSLAAVSTANSASSAASAAVSTANSASSTANLALSTAQSAESDATNAVSFATQALNIVAGTIQFTAIPDVASIPPTPSDLDGVQIIDSTGIELFTPLSGLPGGFVGSPQLFVQLQYDGPGLTWEFAGYGANDPDFRYLKREGGNMTGALVMENQQQARFREASINGTNFVALQAPASVSSDKTITLPDVTGTVITTGDTGTVTSTIIADGTIVNGDISATAAIDKTKISGTAITAADTGTVTSTMIADGTIVDADINASAAIAGTKISPDFGSQNLVTTGTATAASLNPTGSSVPANGVYLPAANTVGVATNSTGRLFINSSGQVGLGTSSPDTLFTCSTTDDTIAARFKAANGIFRILPFETGAGVKVAALNGNESAFANLIQQGASHQFVVGTNSAVTIDSSSRVGIGTATPGFVLDVKTAGGRAVVTDSGTGMKIAGITGAGAEAFAGLQGNPVAFLTDGAERARIDSSGRLLVGTSSSSTAARLVVQAHSGSATDTGIAVFAYGGTSPADGVGLGSLRFSDSNHGPSALVQAERDGGTWTSGSSQPTRLVFSTTADGASSPTERMRLHSNGRLSVSYAPSTAEYKLDLRADEASLSALGIFQASSSFAQTSVSIDVNRATTNNTYNYLRCSQQGFAVDKLFIRDSGTVQNATGTYNTISDLKLKENIIDAPSQWDDIKNIRIRNYNFKPETNHQTHKQIGVVAQELELVCPGLVEEAPDLDAKGDDLGTTTKGVKSSILYMKAVKALQEAMERIETLEAKVAALEGV